MANVKLVYINSTGGYTQPTTTTDVVDNIGKISLTGVSGVAVDAGSAKISNLGAPSAGTDAATKDYVDALSYGVSWKSPVRAVSVGTITLSGAQTVDGVSLTDGDRVLVAGQGGSLTVASVDNGIYVVDTGGSWARSADANAVGELPAGSAVFVTEGTTYADTQFVLTTNGTITPGTTALTFSQFGAGGTSYTAGDGLVLTGTIFSVDLDTNSGLEFNGGNLRIDVANTDQLTLDGSGLSVAGVPSLFKINGSAVSANVTHTNLNSLTDGSSIVSLHGHQTVGKVALASGSGVTAAWPVYISGSNTVENARADDAAKANVVGVSVATNTGAPVYIVQSGSHVAMSGLTAGTVYFLGDTGSVVAYSALTSGNRAIQIGVALSTTELLVNIQDKGVKP